MIKQGKLRTVRDYAVIFLGCLLHSAAVVVFIRPVDVIIGGVGGVAQMLAHITGFLPMGVLVILLNLPLFLISFRQMGKQFLVRTIVATVASGIIIDVLQQFVEHLQFTDDKLLSVLYGGVLMGLGVGLVFSRGATTGGSDIIAKLVAKKRPHISLGKTNLVINAFVITAAGFVYRSPEAALYAVFVQYITSAVIDMLLNGIDNASAALIVTQKPKEMSEAVMAEIRRGCTGLEGHGMYTNQPNTTLIVAARPHEISRLKLTANAVDPQSFMIFLNVREVLGLGFKENKG